MSVSHIAVDWGTTSFRLWALDAAGRVLAARRSDEGLNVAGGIGFERVLESHLSALGIDEGVPAVLCGMVGARAGWVEAAYLDAPVRLDDLAARAVAAPASRRPVRILPGIAQRSAGRPDVMRGEETQLLGLASEGFSGLACLPGTHSKWVRLSSGRLEGFSTFMTGELFQLVRTASVVKPAVGAGTVDPDGPDFAADLIEALEAPELLTHRLFALRAGWLLAATPAEAGLARLSGLLLGAELAGAARLHGSLDGTVLVASGPIAALYARALTLSGAKDTTVRDAEDSVRAGLHAAARALFPLLEGAAP